MQLIAFLLLSSLLISLQSSCAQVAKEVGATKLSGRGHAKISRDAASIAVAMPGSANLFALSPSLARFKSCDELQETMGQQIQAQEANLQAQMQWEATHSGQGAMGRPAAPSDRIVVQGFPSRGDAAVNNAVPAAPNSSGAITKNSVAPVTAQAQAESVSANDSGTNVQESGVDEADFVKLGPNHIFVAGMLGIDVIDRSNLKSLGVLPLGNATQANLYVGPSLLILAGISSIDSSTIVRIYKTSPGILPVLAKEIALPESLQSSRYVGNQLVMVFASYLQSNVIMQGQSGGIIKPTLTKPIVLNGDGQSVNGVQCVNIVKPSVSDGDLRMTKIVSLDTSAADKPMQMVAVIGGSDHIYMSQENLYLAKQGAQWSPWLGDSASADSRNMVQQIADTLLITKISVRPDGALVATAVGTTIGRAKDQWAFSEYPAARAIAVATTTGSLDDGSALNHLDVLGELDGQLNSLSPRLDFAPKEDIRAVRYVQNMAYVVTFKKTDPLFAFDLTDPAKPKLLGELKVPGFSTYLHPVAPGRLVGVGFDAQDLGEAAVAARGGIQVSLFDISKPSELKKLDSLVLGARGAESEVTTDAHAFYFEPVRKWVGVPLIEAQMPGAFSGAVIFQLQQNNLVQKARLSHQDLSKGVCDQNANIRRLITVDTHLLSVSNYAIKAHKIDSPEQTDSITMLSSSPQNRGMSRCDRPAGGD